MPSISSPSCQLVPIQYAALIRGQRAWLKIKSTASEQRQLWRDIGEALWHGRRLHKADRAFSQWVKDVGFDDIGNRVRSDAMWLAMYWDEVSNDWNPALTHPTAIRAEFKAKQADTPPSPDLTITSPSRLTASIEQVAPQAHKINKLASMAERGEGQEQKTAQKYLAKKAKDMGMEPEELVNQQGLTKAPTRPRKPLIQPINGNPHGRHLLH
ncbi:MAG: hypothetical protein Q7U28_02675 [Aquabacterium sp.]|nr:hypothetical protein [Aquabacterium sp.]